MTSFRKKLGFAFGGVIAILLAVCALGVAVLWQYQGALDKFLYENWRSIQYGQAVVDSVGTLDDLARGAAESRGADAGNPSANIRRLAERPLAEIERNIDAENRNITLHPEEDALAGDLTSKWNGQEGYRAIFERLIDGHATAEVRQATYAELRKLSPQVKAAAQAVISLNLKNMTPIEGRAKAMADNASRAMIMLAIAGVAIAAAFLVIVSRSILRPLRTLTQSAREIEQGNLDLTVQVRSRDEVGQLAAAFNSMAAKLREFRRTDRAKLVRTQRTTQLALGSLPDAVAIISPDGRVEMANDTAQKLFGLRPELELKSAAGTGMAELFERAISERRPIQAKGYDAAIQIFNGQERFFLPMAVPIIDDGQLAGVTLVLADVTNLRKLDAMKSGLLSVVSHELKTPLTSIRMATHLLLEERIGPLTAKQTELVTAAKDDSDRLNEIIENLLDMGRIEAGRELLELKPVPVQRLINDALDEARSSYRDKGVSLEADIPDNIPDVQADPERISHVFSNLLSNALKFTSSGGHVRIDARGGDDVVRLTVSDTGIGIAPEFLPRVFERFYRAPGQSNRTGAGLGLAIAKEIVEVHGGSISAQSNPGIGSRFGFTLSRADIEARRMQKARNI